MVFVIQQHHRGGVVIALSAGRLEIVQTADVGGVLQQALGDLVKDHCTNLDDIFRDEANRIVRAVAMLIAEASALPSIAVTAITAATHRRVLEIHVVSLVVRSLVAFVADHTSLVLLLKNIKMNEKIHCGIIF